MVRNVALGLSSITVIACAAFSWNEANRTAAIVTSLFVYAASATVGVMLGFLFGMPRSRVVEQLQSSGLTPGEDRPSSPVSYFLGSSNLIKVSDWLTTIVIGLGLVNLGQVQPALAWLAGQLQGAFGGGAYGATAGLAVAIWSSLAGFILSYLWTTIRVRELLEEAERSAHGQVQVPDCVGKAAKTAATVLSSYWLKADPGDHSNGKPVASQTPAAGDIVARGTSVTLTF